MEGYRLYGLKPEDFERVWKDYEKFFGERPPHGNNERDYIAAVRACESAAFSRMCPGYPAEPVKEWPSQADAKEPWGRE